MVKNTANINAAKIILEAKQKISLKVGGNAIVIDPTGVTIIGTMVKINSGGAGEETSYPTIVDPEDAAAADTGEPGWLRSTRAAPAVGASDGNSTPSTTSRRPVRASRRGSPLYATCSIRRRPGVMRCMSTIATMCSLTLRPGAGVYNPKHQYGDVGPKRDQARIRLRSRNESRGYQASGTKPDIRTASRADYVNGSLAEEAHSDALGEQAHNELAAAGIRRHSLARSLARPMTRRRNKEPTIIALPTRTPRRATSMRRVGRPVSRQSSMTTNRAG